MSFFFVGKGVILFRDSYQLCMNADKLTQCSLSNTIFFKKSVIEFSKTGTCNMLQILYRFRPKMHCLDLHKHVESTL